MKGFFVKCSKNRKIHFFFFQLRAVGRKTRKFWTEGPNVNARKLKRLGKTQSLRVQQQEITGRETVGGKTPAP